MEVHADRPVRRRRRHFRPSRHFVVEPRRSFADAGESDVRQRREVRVPLGGLVERRHRRGDSLRRRRRRSSSMYEQLGRPPGARRPDKNGVLGHIHRAAQADAGVDRAERHCDTPKRLHVWQRDARRAAQSERRCPVVLALQRFNARLYVPRLLQQLDFTVQGPGQQCTGVSTKHLHGATAVFF